MTIPAGTQGVEIWIVVDNDAIGVYWNGALIGGPLIHEGCANAEQPMRFAVNPASVTGSDVLAIRLRDRGAESYGNVQVVTGAMPNEPATCDVQCQENGGFLGDPVQSFSGAFTYGAVDMAVPGRGPTPSFARSYSSRDDRVGAMGAGWMHNYSVRLRHPGDGSPDLLFVGPNGNTDRFTRNNDETFSPPPAVYRTLVRNPSGTFTVTEKSQSTWTFDAAGALTAITDRFGNVSNLGYNGAGDLESISDPAGRGSLTLAYTGGKLTSVTDWATPPRTVTYQYDPQGRLWKVTDREGKVTTFGYDGSSSRLATITDPRGNVAITLTYNAQGKVAIQRDAKGLVTGATTTFSYVVNGDGTRVTTSTAPPTSFEPTFSPTTVDTYTAQGFLTSRVMRPTSTEMLTETYTYDAIGNRTSVTDPRGARTDFCYDRSHAGGAIAGSRGNLTRIVGPAPTSGANRPVRLIAYDAKSNITQTIAPNGVPSGATVTCSTNLSAFDGDFVTDLAYDANEANLLSMTNRYTDPDSGPTTATTKYEQSDAANPGLVTRIIPPRGNTTGTPDYTFATSFTYFGVGSRSGMLESTTDALGNKTTFDYDAVGRLTISVDPVGNAAGGVPADHRTELTYDKENRVRLVKLPAPVAGGAQLISETRYDEVGNPVVRIDANGQVTSHQYDERDSLHQVKESPNPWSDPATPPAGVITTEYAYDAAGNMTRMTRAKGDASVERAIEYAYDGRGLVRRETQYPSWPATTPILVATSTYDFNGNVAVATDQLGRTTTFGYDQLNRSTSINYSDASTPDVAYAYDANSNRTSMTDGTGASTYAYDELDRLLSVTSPGPKTVGYRYDRDGNRTKLIYPDATTVTYTFDKASRLRSLQDWASRSVAYTYWPDGLVKTVTNADASVATHGYDNARRPTDILHQKSSKTIAHHSYALDLVGNVTGLQEFVSGITDAGSWGGTTKVNTDGTPRAQQSPDVAIGADAASYLVWADSRPTSGLPDIYFAKRDPTTGTWGTNQLVNDNITGSQTVPSIAVDGNNNAYAVWADTRRDVNDIYFAKRAATSCCWATNVLVNDDSGGATQTSPSIAVGSSGAGVAVWYDTRSSQKHIYSARLTASSSWLSDIRVTTDTASNKGNPDVAIGPDGTAYAVWQDNRSVNDDIWFASLAPGAPTWSANTKISDTTSNDIQPSIAIDSAGNLFVTWTNLPSSLRQVRVIRRPAGSSTWDPSVVVSDPAKLSDQPSVAVSADGSAMIAWRAPAASNTKIWTAVYEQSTGSWSPPALASGDYAANTTDGSPSIAIGGAGTELSWDGYTSSPTSADIFARRSSLSSGTDAYGYGFDRLYRLTSVTGPNGSRNYLYDSVGNRTSKIAGGATSYTYDRADRMTAAGSASVTVDATGSTTVRGGDTFVYDQVSRLRTASVAGTTQANVYDGDGVRFSSQVGAGPVTRYVTDTAASLPVTLDDGTRKYVWGLGLAYAVSSTGIEVHHADRLGSIRVITDGTGAVVGSFRTDEFGTMTSSTGSAGSPFRYTGELLDTSGLTYLRARYYDPTTGRFLTRDPWGGAACTPQSLNRFIYTQNNPVTWTDPSGLKSGILMQTAGLCMTGNGGVALYGTVSLCWVKDINGQTAMLLTGGSGGITNLSGFVGYGATTATRTIDELKDYFTFAGISGGAGLGGGVDITWDTDLDPIQITITFGGSLDVPIPADFHAGGSWTIILPPIPPPPGPLSSYREFADVVFATQSVMQSLSDWLP